MFSFEGKLEPKHLRVVKLDHNIPLIGNNTFLTTLQQSFLLHKLERIEFPSGEIPRKKYSRKSPSANTPNNLKIREFDFVLFIFMPNWLNFYDLAFETF
jgi:hypothetical protein